MKREEYDSLPYDLEFKVARQALQALQDKLATVEGWRASLNWEVVQDAICTLDEGYFLVHERADQPNDFQHWREKFSFLRTEKFSLLRTD